MENTVNYYRKQKEVHVVVANAFPGLLRLKREGDTSAFNALLLKALPGVKKYVQKRLYIALAKGQIDKNRYRTEEFTDQLFIEAYEHFDEIENERELYPWLFKKADELLEDTLVEEEFDSYFFENIDIYARKEWDEMEEKFSTDGDGDLMMIEELDDISYPKNDYVLNPIFIEEEDNEIIKRLDRQLGAENIRRHAEMVLFHLPAPVRTVYELHTEHQFDAAEIAKIRNRSIKEVENLLETARKGLRASFLNRYPYKG